MSWKEKGSKQSNNDDSKMMQGVSKVSEGYSTGVSTVGLF